MTWQDYSDNRGPGRPAKWPLRKMSVGESLFIPGFTANRVCKDLYYFKPLKFKTRTVVSGGVIGARVWRIA